MRLGELIDLQDAEHIFGSRLLHSAVDVEVFFFIIIIFTLRNNFLGMRFSHDISCIGFSYV